MNNLAALTAGELKRINTYKILASSLYVIAFWIAFLYFIDDALIMHVVAILLFVDATYMSILYIGAVVFFEKQEGTFKTLMVTPVRISEYIISKGIAVIVTNVLTVILVTAYVYWFKDAEPRIASLAGAAALIGFLHAFIGFWISFYAKDFTSLLMRSFIYMIVFVLPVILVEFDVITSRLLELIIYILPTQASATLMNAAAGLPVETWETWFSAVYLVVLTAVVFTVTVVKFPQFIQRQGG